MIKIYWILRRIIYIFNSFSEKKGTGFLKDKSERLYFLLTKTIFPGQMVSYHLPFFMIEKR